MITPQYRDGPLEERYFGELQSACTANDPVAAIECLLAWLGCCCECSGFEAEKFAREITDETLSREIELLDAAARLSSPWCGEDLLRAVAGIRIWARDDASGEQQKKS